MKIYLSPSTQDTNDYTGGSNEEVQMRRIAFPCADLLRAAGHEVRVGGTVSARANADDGNAWGADLYVAIHSNSGGAHGTEVFYYPGSEKGKALAEAVYKYVSAASTAPDRGVKTSSGYIETRVPKAPAIIVETAFHDCAEEAAEIRDNPSKFAEAIARGILEVAGGTIPQPVGGDTSWAYVIIHAGNAHDVTHYLNDAKSRGDAAVSRQVPKAAWKPEYIGKAADVAAAAVKDAK